ncbi:MAG: MFS transporter, partial [Aquabacterium sp.]
RRLREPAVAWFFASIFFTVLAHTAMYAFFSLYLVALGYSKTQIGVIWAVSVLAEIAFFATQGRWLRRATDLRWLHAVALVAAVRFALTAVVAHWLWLLLLVQCAHALTFAAHHSACTSVIARHFPDRLRSRGAALYTILGYGLPGVVGGVAGGALIESAGLESVFWAASVAGVLAALCYRAAFRHAPGQGGAMG